MSYPSEFASKLAYVPLVRNENVRQFLAECSTCQHPAGALAVPASRFEPIPQLTCLPPNLQVVAFDGSRWEAALESKPQSPRVGFVQVGQVRFQLGEFLALCGRSPVDPLAVSALQRQRQLVDLVVPSTGVCWREHPTVRESFRAAVYRSFSEPLAPGREPLVQRLFELAAIRPGPLATGDPQFLRLHRCPCCGEGPLMLGQGQTQYTCPKCDAVVYPTDCLRLHEEVQELESNENVLTRLMSALEHLLVYDEICRLARQDWSAVARTAWFIDGALALFGPASWLHAPLQHALFQINQELQEHSLGPLILIGVQKTGQLADHARRIRAQVPAGTVLAVDDQYRYSRVVTSRAPNAAGFGRQSYYGQDFLFRSASGRMQVFCLPYPSASKTDPAFNQAKTDLGHYRQLPVVLALLESLASSRYADALIPTLLAHRVTAFSRRPGGRVLELFARSQLSLRPSQAPHD